MSTKQTVAQDIMTYEALYRIKPLLDDFAKGLENCSVLKCVRVFPELFLPLFVYTGNLSADVLEAICENESTAALWDSTSALQTRKRDKR